MQGVGNETLNANDKNTDDDKSKSSNCGEEAFQSFVQNTTLHGARYLYAENIFRRLFWVLVLIASFSFCIFQVLKSIEAFNNRPFITKISSETSEQEGKFNFPAVTMCNANFFNKRRYRYEFKSKYNETEIEKKINDISVLSTRAVDKMLTTDFKRRSPELFQRLESAKDINRVQEILSHQIEEMLLPKSRYFFSCSINGKPCTKENFTKHISSAYGQCYTFNSAESGRPLLNATMAGQNSGLMLYLNIEKNSYIQNTLRPWVGIVMIVHDQKRFPFMGEHGMVIQPGISTLCAIKRKKIKNLKAPYETNCTENRTLDMFRATAYVDYTQEACLIKCRNEFTIKRCGCTPPEFKADAPICSPNDTMFCVLPSYEEFGTSKEKLACEQNCAEPCEYVEYETSLSYSGLQTETLVDYLMEVLGSSPGENISVERAIYEPLLNMTQSERERYIEENIISLNIYFEDLSYEVITQTPVYEWWTIFGNLGGMFGLFLGMSLLTILEVLEFFFTRICCVLKGLASGQRRSLATVHADS